MVDLRLELAAGFPKIAASKVMDLCGVSTLSGSEGEKARRASRREVTRRRFSRWLSGVPTCEGAGGWLRLSHAACCHGSSQH
jgi:hypothetical protein